MKPNHFSWRGRVRWIGMHWLAPLGLIGFSGGGTPLCAQGNITSIRQYEQITDPFQREVAAMLGILPTGQVMAPVLFAWNQMNISILTAIEDKADDAMAQAITTNTIKDFKVRVQPQIEKHRLILAKLKKDLELLENEDAGLKNPAYRPPPEQREAMQRWEHYSKIRGALKKYEFKFRAGNDATLQTEVLEDAEKTLEDRAKVLNEGLLTTLQRLNRARFALTSFKPEWKFMTERLEPLNKTMFAISSMAEELATDGHTPRKQWRLIVRNESKDLLYLIQILTPTEKKDGFQERIDCRYPIVLPPVPEKSDASETLTRIPVACGDKLRVRVVTYGEGRRQIAGAILRGGQLRLDLNSITRGFYYLGYETTRQDGALIVSRWYPLTETYQWKFTGDWGAGDKNAPVVGTTDAKSLRNFLEPLQITGDRIEWLLPATDEAADKFSAGVAHVTGDVMIIKQGPTSSAAHRQNLPEKGSGNFEVKLERW